jgi:hemolysin D
MVIPLRGRDSHARKAELEFLPAALEIVETPASPIGRAIAGLLILFFAITVIWASFGRIDIVATAQGKIVPTGRTKVIQPLEAGLITAIHVKDGDPIKAGQVLIELDRTVTKAERDRIAPELLRARLDVARLKALRVGLERELLPSDFQPPAGASEYEIARTRAAMIAQSEQQKAKIASLDQQIAQKAAEAEEGASIIAKLKASLPLLEETADIREKAMRLEYGNRIAHLDAQIKLVDARHGLVGQERRAAEVEAAKKALEWQRAQAKAEYAAAITSELAQVEQDAAQLADDMIKAEKRMQDQVLRAPIDGTVQQLAIHTVGGVVTPAQALMVVVPSDSHLEVEAMVSNRDIGFVDVGQPVEIKVDTFNFTRYGLLHGEVLGVSQDAIAREKPADRAGANKPNGALSESSEPQGQELSYAARVSLNRTSMQVDGKRVNLSPGMAVTVEIKTGTRRIIEYLLSPVLRYKQESLRER